MYFRKKTSGGRVYLQIAESQRVGGPGPPAGDRHPRAPRRARGERPIGAAGALGGALRDPGDGADRGAGRSDGGGPADRAGPGVRAAVGRDRLPGGDRGPGASKRKHGFALERAIFLTVLHRLMGGGSDLAADRWREDYRIAGAEALELHHLYRAMAWLGEELPETEQDARTPFAPRCTKDLVEERLFAHRRDLFSRLDLVFMDTTSLYFEGARRADPRPPRPQQGPSPGPAPDDPGGPDRWRRAAGLLGDVAGQCRRRHHPDPGDRPAAPALRDRPDLRGRRPRHDQRRDRGGARGAQAAVSARHP